MMAHISSGLGGGVCAFAALQQSAITAAQAVLSRNLAERYYLSWSAIKMPTSAAIFPENGS
jgi:hypothetical protein